MLWEVMLLKASLFRYITQQLQSELSSRTRLNTLQVQELFNLSHNGVEQVVVLSIVLVDFEMSLLSKIVGFTGWSPIGKALVIHIDETAFQGLVAQTIKGSLSNLINDNIAIITLDMPIKIDGSDRHCIRAYTRHNGFGFYRLPFGFIAVNLAVDSNELQAPSFAVASIKLCK